MNAGQHRHSAGVQPPRGVSPCRRWVPVLLAAVPLVACGGAPNEAQVQAALQRHFAQAVAPAQQHFGPDAGSGLVPTVQAVALQGCQSQDRGHYLCDAQVTLHSKVLGLRQASTRLLLAHDEQGWRVLSQL